MLLGELRESGAATLELPIPTDARRDGQLLAGRHVHLSRPSPIGSAEVLGLMPLAAGALASRIATHSCPHPEAAAQQRAPLADEELQLRGVLTLEGDELLT